MQRIFSDGQTGNTMPPSADDLVAESLRKACKGLLGAAWVRMQELPYPQRKAMADELMQATVDVFTHHVSRRR